MTKTISVADTILELMDFRTAVSSSAQSRANQGVNQDRCRGGDIERGDTREPRFVDLTIGFAVARERLTGRVDLALYPVFKKTFE